MGSNAICLKGEVAPSVIESANTASKGVNTIDAPGLVTVLREGLGSFVRQRIGTPHDASLAVIKYLSEMRVFFRSENDAGEASPQWNLHICFPDCGGMTYIQADVAFHWCNLWLAAESDSVTHSLLMPAGFSPKDPISVPEGDPTFLAVAGLGYVIYHATRETPDQRFEIEDWHYEVDEALAEARVRQLASQFDNQMADGRCRCQVCMPELALASIEPGA